MKILAISHRAELTGAERSLATAVQYLTTHGCVVLAVVPCYGALIDRLQEAGADVRIFPFHRWTTARTDLAADIAGEAESLAQLAKREGCDIVYTNTSVINVGALAAGFAGLPHVWHIREFLWDTFLGSKALQADFIRRTANRVLFNSHATYEGVGQGECWDNAAVVYNFVDMPPAPSRELQAASISHSVELVLHGAGKVSAEALERLSRHWPAEINRVHVVTASELAHRDRQLIEQRLGDRVSSIRFLASREHAGREHGVCYLGEALEDIRGDVVLLELSALVPRCWLGRLREQAKRMPLATTVSALTNTALQAAARDVLPTATPDVDRLNDALAGLPLDTGQEIAAPSLVCTYIKAAAITDIQSRLIDGTLGQPKPVTVHESPDSRRAWEHWESRAVYVHWNQAAPAARQGKATSAPAPVSDVTDNGHSGDSADFSWQLRLLLDTPALAKAPKLLILGTVAELKRPLDAVLALAQLQHRGFDGHLLIAGPYSPGSAYVEKLQQVIHAEALQHRVHLLGEVANPRPLLLMCDLLLVCAEAEPWGRTAVEAMLLAKPVIGTNAGGLREIVQHNETGLLYPPGDINALADAIATLATDAELRARMGQLGWSLARQTYSFHAYGSAIMEALKDVEGKPSPIAGIAAYVRALSHFSAPQLPLTACILKRLRRYAAALRVYKRGVFRRLADPDKRPESENTSVTP